MAHLDTASGDDAAAIVSPSPWQKKPYQLDDMRIFEIFEYPIWCFDVENRRQWWSNNAGLALWEASSLQEFLARDFSTMTDSTIQRITQIMYKVRHGEQARDQWTFYPQGKPVIVDATIYGWPIVDDKGARLAMLVHGRKMESEEVSNGLLRAVEAVRHLPSPVIQFNREGEIVYHNSVAIKIFGPTLPHHNVLTLFVDISNAQGRIAELYDKGSIETSSAVLITVDGTRTYTSDMKLITDPVTGDKHTLWNMRDATFEENLKVAKEEAEKANKLKSEFLAMISHELRTPLHGMLGFAELLEVTQLDEVQRKYLGTMQASASSLMSVINDLLDFSKIESGKVQLETMEFELETIIDDSVSCVTAQAQEKRLDLQVVLPDDLKHCKVKGDPFRIRQILINLLSNAVKFTCQGSIVLSIASIVQKPAKIDDGRLMIRFMVKDTGIGIPAESLPFLFQRFTQVDNSVSRRFGGTGLGLAICKLLATMMNGKIGVESTFGVGSSFWLDVPLFCLSRKRHMSTTLSASALSSVNSTGTVPLLQPVLHKKTRTLQTADTSMMVVDNSDDDKHSEKSESRSSPIVQRGLRVLVAEDNPVNQHLIEVVLKKLGHDFFLAPDGVVALELAKQWDFDLILMDIQMPKMDGFQATRAIRDLHNGKDVPIIGLTAGYVKDNAHLYEEAGMSECIAKPFRMHELQRVIQQHVLKEDPASPLIK